MNKPTWQAHPWPNKDNDYRSENAVDGMYTDRSYKGGQCTINADNYYTAEWRVDLGNVLQISHIRIFYRTFNQSMLFLNAHFKSVYEPANKSLISCPIQYRSNPTKHKVNHN